MTQPSTTQHPAFAPLTQGSDDLRHKAIRSGAVTLLDRGGSLVLGIVSTVVMSRLLTPRDFGTVAMITSITGFAHLFRDFGLSTATIQSPNLTHQQASAFFWINAVTGSVLAILTAVSAPLIASFYKEPILLTLTMALAIPLLFNGIAIQHTALLRRMMRFGSLALNGFMADFLGTVAGIIAAIVNPSPWSIVIGVVTRNTVSFVGLWFQTRWVPGRPAPYSEIRTSLLFGGQISLYTMIIYMARNVDRILIGRFFSPESLGVFNKAYALMDMPISIIQGPLDAAALPAMSRLQSDPTRYASFYKHYATILAFASFPMVALCFIQADAIIYILLGSQWGACVPIFRILAFASFIACVANLSSIILLSTGQGKRYLQWGIVYSIVNVVAFVIGFSWGVTGITYAHGVVAYLLLIPSHIFAFKNTPIKLSHFFSSLYAPLLSTLVAALPAVGVTILVSDQNPWIRLTAVSLVFVSAYVGSYFIYPTGRRTLATLWGHLESLGIGKILGNFIRPIINKFS